MGINRLNEFWPEWSIGNVLGEGSFGRVYEAQKTEGGVSTNAAIKVISIPTSNAEIDALRSEGLSESDSKKYFEDIVKDFLNEVKVMINLKGAPNIVAVEDYKILEKRNTIGWDIYIRMELLTSFKSFIQNRILSEEEVIKLGIDIASALEICQNKHIIHRDIKPANIFIDSYGNYKLGDFGVAKELEKTTGAASSKGTFGYMAPEVTRGVRYDQTVDIYSLGLVMYFLLNNNRPPFVTGERITYDIRREANERRLAGEPLSPPCNASPQLASIILTACSFDPAKRFRNATAMKNALIACRSAISRTPVHQRENTNVPPPITASSDNDDVTVASRPVKASDQPIYPPQNEAPPKKKTKISTLVAIIAIILVLATTAVFVIPSLITDRNNVVTHSDRDDDKDNATNDDNIEGEKIQTMPASSEVPVDITYVGDDFTVLCREDNDFGKYTYEIVPDEGATDTVNQAVYQRNRDICDMFGLSEIKAVTKPGTWADKDDFINTFRNSIDAALGEFDLIMGYSAYMAEPELVQYFYDFNEIPYIKDNLDAEYYFQDAVKELTVNGKLKYMIGDFSLTYWDRVYVMYFNKQIAEEYNLENIYDLVNNGQWTIDKCLEMASGKWKDNNNDDWPGVEDTYGYISDIPYTTDTLHAQFDVPRTTTSSGEVKFDMDVTKMTSILEKMINFKKTNDCYMIYTSSNQTEEAIGLNEIFMEGRALFYPTVLQEASKFRSMEIGFGIVPYPMWDEEQSGYLTSARSDYSVACVPADARDLEFIGAIFDTLALLSYEDVIPAYYDKALKYKMTRDEDSAAMLDIIRDGLIVNFGDFFGWALDPADKMFRELIRHENTNFASYYASYEKAWTRRLNEFLTKFE